MECFFLYHCAKCIINAGIKTVIYDEEYRNIEGLEILKASGITVKRYSL